MSMYRRTGPDQQRVPLPGPHTHHPSMDLVVWKSSPTAELEPLWQRRPLDAARSARLALKENRKPQEKPLAVPMGGRISLWRRGSLPVAQAGGGGSELLLANRTAWVASVHPSLFQRRAPARGAHVAPHTERFTRICRPLSGDEGGEGARRSWEKLVREARGGGSSLDRGEKGKGRGFSLAAIKRR